MLSLPATASEESAPLFSSSEWIRSTIASASFKEIFPFSNAILENCEAGTYFVQVTDDNGCVVFGNVEVLLDTVVNTEECVAEFDIEQAFSDNEMIPFELFVYVFGYDDSNEYFWSFGDEGTSTDPFPTWTYETNGPYQLCLTVSNEENDCLLIIL